MSRGRKKTKSRRSGLQVVRPVAAIPEVCDCPECSGEDVDPQDLVDDLVTGGGHLLETDDPLEAELFGAGFLAVGEVAGDVFTEVFSGGLVPALAQLATPESLAVLLALDAVGAGPASAEAVRSLLGSGVPAPAWAGELGEPPKLGPCHRFANQTGGVSMLLCSFDRAGRSHGFVVNVDHADCDAAADIMLFPGELLDQVVDRIQVDGGRSGLTITTETLDPAEFRWQVEHALDARAVHDREDGSEPEDLGDDDGPGYHLLAALLRARMAGLPEPPRPPAPHGDDSHPLAVPEMLVQFAQGAWQVPAGGSGPKLPAKRKKAGGVAPIYQIRVDLSGTKPPIWRRLELPADTSLARLHQIIQTAFGWDDSHLHVFETGYGAFGVADRELGHRSEAPVTLEQVAPGVGDRLQYLYDFGDGWAHRIVVEKLVDRQPVAYPRCTAGRRAGPPDDCGGIWGYDNLIEVLSDPGHPEHGEQLEWMGLDSAADFQPDRFDAAEVTKALTDRR